MVGEPHEIFTRINNYHLQQDIVPQKTFFVNQYKLYRSGYQVNPDVNWLESKHSKDNLEKLMIAADAHECDEKDKKKERGLFVHAVFKEAEDI